MSFSNLPKCIFDNYRINLWPTSSVNCGILCLLFNLTWTEHVPPLPSKVILSVDVIDNALVCCSAGVVGVRANLNVIGAGLLLTIGTTAGFFTFPPTMKDPKLTIDSGTSICKRNHSMAWSHSIRKKLVIYDSLDMELTLT